MQNHNEFACDINVFYWSIVAFKSEMFDHYSILKPLKSIIYNLCFSVDYVQLLWWHQPAPLQGVINFLLFLTIWRFFLLTSKKSLLVFGQKREQKLRIFALIFYTFLQCSFSSQDVPFLLKMFKSNLTSCCSSSISATIRMYLTVLISFASNICLHVRSIDINRILHVVRELKLKALFCILNLGKYFS
jgi:hypothetical protein